MSDPFAPLGKPDAQQEAGAVVDRWLIVTPIPEDAPEPILAHARIGAPSTIWRYHDADGRLLGFVRRFDADGGKLFRPLNFWRDQWSGKTAWKTRSWPPPRPLYGLDELARRPSAPALVVEGEKACDAARLLLPDHVVVTSPNGADAAAKTDWTPLQRRQVVIWPDHDAAGERYAQDVASLLDGLAAAPCRIVRPSDDTPPGWDAADALASGMATDAARAFIKSAGGRRAQPSNSNQTSDTAKRPRAQSADQLAALVDDIELWHDPQRKAHATIPIDQRFEHHPIHSSAFADVVRLRNYRANGTAISQQQLDMALDLLSTRARFSGRAYKTHRRAAFTEAGIFIDLCDDDWRVVRVTAQGWEVTQDPSIKMLRSPGMLPLPDPEAGYEITELARFINLESEDDLILVACWAVAALTGAGPYPILTISGEQGSAKSVTTRVLRTLVDPHALPHRTLPETERDLAIAAHNTRVLAYDNVSFLRATLSDALCRLATGAGFATRKLHSDLDETLLFAACPILFNGIPDVAARPDLADRSISLHLPRIPEIKRLTEDELWRDFKTWHPRLLGTLCDGLQRMLERLP